MADTKQKLVVFDFDYTLYNAELWKELAYNSLADLLGEERTPFKKIAQEVYDETRKIGYFDPVLFSQALHERFAHSEKSAADILKIIHSQELFERSYYPDIQSELAQLKQEAELAIFSTNDGSFQAAKQQMVNRFFKKELVFVSGNKPEILHKITNLTERYSVFLVDDLIDILKMAKHENSAITTIWIKQGPYATVHTGLADFQPDWTVQSLHELHAIVGEVI